MGTVLVCDCLRVAEEFDDNNHCQTRSHGSSRTDNHFLLRERLSLDSSEREDEDRQLVADDDEAFSKSDKVQRDTVKTFAD